MLKPPLPPNETERLSALHALKILDTPSEERFDRITRLAARLFDVPIVLVSLIDENRQWFKSCYGLDASETSRDISFCGYAILNDEAFVIPNALGDERFADNPLVTGEPHIRFYTGQPLAALDGSRIGTLCLIDRQQRQMSHEDLQLLKDLADMVETQLNVVGLAISQRDALAEAQRMAHLGSFEWDIAENKVTWSDELYRIFGFQPQEFEPTLEVFLAQNHPDDHDRVQQTVMTAFEEHQPFEMEERVVRPNGEIRYLFSRGEVITDHDGNPIKLVGICQDVTERKRAEETIQERERALAEAQRMAHLGSFEWDIAKNKVTWSDELYHIFGFQPQEFEPTLEVFLAQNHPDDRDRVQQTVMTAFEEHQPFEIEERVVRPDGEIRHLFSRGEVMSDPDGTPIKLVGVCHDVTEQKRAEEELQKLSLVASKTTNSVIITDKDEKIEWVNNGFTQITGYTLSEVEGKTPREVLLGSLSDGNSIARMQAKLKAKETFIGTIRCDHKDGSSYWLSVTATPILNADGEIERIFSIGTDITKRVEAENQLQELNATLEQRVARRTASLQESEAKNRALLNAIPDWMFRLDADCAILDFSPAKGSDTPPPPSQFLGKKMSEVFPPEVARQSEQYVARALQTGEPQIHEYQFPMNGNIRYYEARIVASDTDEVLALVRDITHRKQAEDALKSAQEYTQNLIDSSLDMFIAVDNNREITVFNKAAEETFGYRAEEVVGKHVNMLYNDSRVGRHVHEALDQRGQFTGEITNRRKNGEMFTALLSASVVFDVGGEPIGVMGISRDITEANRIAQERDSFFNLSLDLLCIAGFDGYFKRLNPAWSKTLDYAEEELLASPFIEFVHPDDRKATLAEAAKLTGGGVTISFENRYRHKDGSYRWLLWSATADMNRELMYATARDITELKRTTDALERARDELTLQESRIRSMYEVASKPEASIDQRLQEALALGAETFELGMGIICRIEGGVCTVLYSNPLDALEPGQTFDLGNTYCDIVFGAGQLVAIEQMGESEYNTHPCYEAFNLESYIGVPVQVNGNPFGTLSFCSFEPKSKPFDQADRDFIQLMGEWISTMLERRQFEEQLRDAKDVAEAANLAKSEFLANMSHEIRTPMNAILGFTEILDGLIDDPQQHGYLGSIQASGKSLLTLINDILDLSKVEAGKLELEYTAINLHRVFGEMEQLFSQRISEKELEFHLEIDSQLPKAIILDETRLRQVLVNLISNAVKFTEIGYVKLSVFNRFLDEEDHSGLDLRFAIEDTGAGIADNQQEVIFGAFEQQEGQSQAKFGGTGLGLAITKRLVEMMGGEIAVVSEVGKGSTFEVTLYNVAVAAGDDLMVRREDEVELDAFQFEPTVILIVDDVETNRELVKGYLQPYGFQCVEAENGEEAIRLTKQYRPGLVLMDLRMPILDGYTASERLKGDVELQTIPIVVLTASTMKRTEERMRNVCDGYLRKPISKKELVEELAKFLPHTVAGVASTVAAVSADAEDVKSAELKPQALETLPELVETLEAILNERFEELKNTAYMDELEAFGAEMQALGEEYGYPPLSAWGQRLTTQAQMFQLDAIPQTLETFAELVEQAKSLL